MSPPNRVPRGWKQMASGKGVDLDNPRVEDVDFNDIAIGLANQCRFTGGLKDVFTHYSIAQHSALVAHLVEPRYQLRALLHDAHEAYWGDDSSPKKGWLADKEPAGAAALNLKKSEWDIAIFARAGLPEFASDEETAAIKTADTMALSIERRDLLNPPADDMTRRAWSWLPEPNPGIRLIPLPASAAYRMFLDTLAGLIWPCPFTVGSQEYMF